MVCLPVSLPINSSTISRSDSSVSPVRRSSRISSIMGTITSIHPERISEMVPSKSNRTTRARAADAPSRSCSITSVFWHSETQHPLDRLVVVFQAFDGPEFLDRESAHRVAEARRVAMAEPALERREISSDEAISRAGCVDRLDWKAFDEKFFLT